MSICLLFSDRTVTVKIYFNCKVKSHEVLLTSYLHFNFQ